MIEIITLALCGVNTVVSIILVILFVKKGVGGFQERDNDVGGNVYCSNCCQPFSASLRACSVSFFAHLIGKFCRLLRQKSLPYVSMPANFFLVIDKIMLENLHIKRY